MKIRTGFVSNSSSSSFCIAGLWTDNIKNYIIPDDTKLSIYINEESDDGYVGLNLDKMRGDETLNEFKARSRNELIANGIPVESILDIGIHFGEVSN